MKTRSACLGLLLALGACGKKEAPPPPPPPQVGFLVLREQPVTLTTELPGRISAFETSEVRPQVSGLVQARLFREGEEVRAGQPLYQIDDAPYRAQVANTRAALARAQAAIGSSQALVRRYGQLVAINAIARQEFENSQTSAAQARADVSAQRAALRAAEIDLGRTRVRAPISGRIGRSAFTTGALVTSGQADPLTTIQRLDTVYVDLSQSSAALLRLRQQILAGQLARHATATRVRLKLEDGSVYPVEGTLQFADVTVDPTTGSQTIRASFTNPQRLLLPGMFVRAEIVEGTKSSGLLVPQRAVSRDEKGNPTVLVIGAGNKVELRPITAPRTVGTDWLVTGGVRPGERIVMDGAMMLRPGAQVTPVPWSDKAPGTAGAPAGGTPQQAR